MRRSTAVRSERLSGSGARTAPSAYSCGAYLGRLIPHAVTGTLTANTSATGT